VDVTTLKQRAARQERAGDLAEAIATYREILDHLEGSPAIKRELPLMAKLGDLLSQTGDAKASVAMYARAAQHYAEHGSAKSISVLCLKVLRADRTQTDVYFRFAQGLLDHGHVEATRAVLVDYAKRAKLAKTLTRLEALAGRPHQEVQRHLEELFAKVEKRARPPSPTPAPAEPLSAVEEPHEEPDEDFEAQELEEEEEREPEEEVQEEDGEDEEEPEDEKQEHEAHPSIVTSDITLPAEQEPAGTVAAALSIEERGGPKGEEQTEEEQTEEEETAPSPASEAIPPEVDWYQEPAARAFEPQTEPTDVSAEPEPFVSDPEPEPVETAGEPEPERIESFDPPAVKTEVPPPEPALGAVTGAEPREEPESASAPARGRDVLFSGLGYHEEKSRPVWLWPTVAAVVVVVGASGLAILLSGDGSESTGGPEGSGAVQESLPASTTGGTALGDPAAVDPIVAPLTAVDSLVFDAGGAVAETVPTVIGDAAQIVGDQSLPAGADTTGQAGAPAAVAPADTGTRPPPRIITSPARAERVLVVEGLQIQSVEDLPSGTGGYRVVQVLASGEGLALTVVPMDRAGPIVGGGALRVSPLRGDSAIGTVRFGDELVTARASVSLSVLEGLLRQLVEIERP